MPIVNTYNDAYLAKLCTEERENRAFADVDEIGVFKKKWRTKLAVLRCYIIVCLECQAQPDDLFSAKLKHYRMEFDATLAQAKADAQDSSGRPLPVFATAILRG